MFAEDLVLSYSFIKLSFHSHRGDYLLQNIWLLIMLTSFFVTLLKSCITFLLSLFREWTLENVWRCMTWH